MAIEFITNLSNSTLVRQNQNHTNRFQEEIQRKVEVSKLSNEQLAKAAEKISSQTSNTSTLRFQENIPLTSTLKTIKIFNETKQPNSLKNMKEVAETEVEDSQESLVENKTDMIGKGFYIVSGNSTSTNKKLLPKADEDKIREKLSEIYNPSGKKKNGGLVNLTL